MAQNKLTAPQVKNARHEGRDFKMADTVPITAQLRWWILGFGRNIRVLEPEALREEIAAELRAVVEAYPD